MRGHASHNNKNQTPTMAAQADESKKRPSARNTTSKDKLNNEPQRRHIIIIVLGDLGRSPRMQYHALSLLEHGHHVTLVGYAGENVIPPLQDDARWRLQCFDGEESPSLLKVIRMEPPTPPKSLRRFVLPVYLLLRLLGLIYSLLHTLFRVVPTAQYRTAANNRKGKEPIPVDCVLIQNPPSIPLLFLAYLFCCSRPLLLHPRPGLVIDWHNLGYTMFDLSDYHPIRFLARIYERIMAPRADGHLCVTAAMKQWLIQNFGLRDHEEKLSVLRDRPPEFFRPTRPMEQHRLMKKLELEFRTADNGLMTRMGVGKDDANRTLFTEISGGKARLRKDRPALVVSSTSWTPDEDFSILLDACVSIDAEVRDRGDDAAAFPHVVVIVTGKGPEKAMYEEKISRLNLQHVSILTMWLEAADYPRLLGCADLGISLHTSTSGIDLPMKVLDYFGCEVPVCAIRFDCLGELVVDGVNGRVFATADELARQMLALLGSVGEDGSIRAAGELEKLREGIRGMARWRENWDDNAKEIILNACPSAIDNEAGHRGEPPMWLKVLVFIIFFVIFYSLTKKFALPK